MFQALLIDSTKDGYPDVRVSISGYNAYLAEIRLLSIILLSACGDPGFWLCGVIRNDRRSAEINLEQVIGKRELFLAVLSVTVS